jgi:hypothetical protein
MKPEYIWKAERFSAELDFFCPIQLRLHWLVSGKDYFESEKMYDVYNKNIVWNFD